jgi:hypothetical protein
LGLNEEDTLKSSSILILNNIKLIIYDALMPMAIKRGKENKHIPK